MLQASSVKQDSTSNKLNSIENLISIAQRKFDVLFEGTNQKFEADRWEIGHLIRRVKSGQNISLIFRRRNEWRGYLPDHFVNVVKAWLLFKPSSAGHMGSRLDIAKILWEVISLRCGNDFRRFTWDTLCEEDLRQAEILMLKEWEKSTCYGRLGVLISFTKFLATHKICRPLYFVPSHTHRKEAYSTTFANNDARLSKLPSRRALEGLAEIYATYAKEPRDRLCIAAIALLVVTGFRVGELLSLPEQCEVEENYRGKPRYGLYYFREKSKNSQLIRDVRWLSPIQSQLARDAIAEIRSITFQFRERAKLLEENDDIVVIPELASQPFATAKQISEIAGISSNVLYRLAEKGILLRQKNGSGPWLYSTYAIGKYLVKDRYRRLWTIDFGNGTYQRLSESLFVVPRFFFRSYTNPSQHLMEPVVQAQIRAFIVPDGKGSSAFERFNIREEDGSYCRVTSHQFRHWLNDIADKGGLPIDVLTRWMGRENPRDTEAYRHATVDERLKWVKAGIKEEVITGTMAEVYFELSAEERDTFLDAQLQAVHFTPMGICIHDFAIEPCPYHLNCVRGCPHYLRTKGSQKEREHLIQIQENTEKALEAARQYAANAGAEVSQAWIRHHEETLKGVKNALDVDDDINTPEGNLVKPTSILLKVINSGSE